MADRHVAIVGAGPGGLTAAMILAKRGYRVTVLEKESTAGGRNAAIRLGPYTFDTGPTFLMMTFILREMFELAGRRLDDYCDVKPLDPMYKLSFADKEIFPAADHGRMRDQIGRLFPGNERGFDAFLRREKVRYERMYPCLQKDYSTIGAFFTGTFMRALPHLALHKSLYSILCGYFSDDTLRTSFTFQAKYLGMSPWECPGAFTIIPYIEQAFGIDHVTGGLSRISDAMEKVAREHGAAIRLSAPVRKVLVRAREAKGVELADGERIDADAVVVNADFGHAATTLFDPGVIRTYTEANLRRRKFSCSTFMLYLGVDKIYDEPHHNVIFANDYRRNISDIAAGAPPSDDMSVYVRNASVTDPTLAPAGQSAIYVLVPVANTSSRTVWSGDLTRAYRDKVLSRIEARTSMKDLRAHIAQEKIITPAEWEGPRSLFLGATFNLGHNLTQMLYFRPHNRFEEVDRCYLVGGGTHPGSGLPTIYESARITAHLIGKDLR